MLAVASPWASLPPDSLRALHACRLSKDIPTSLNSSSDWALLIEPYNLHLDYIPTAVTLPKTPQQVSESVACAAAVGVKVQARSGGHSYGSFSLGERTRVW
jgi:FAD/FMN-containing dehydrogenase